MMNPIKPGLRTIHNGSNGVAKTIIIVPAGDELVITDAVAEQLQRDNSAFKDGSAPPELLAALAAQHATSDDDEPAVTPAETPTEAEIAPASSVGVDDDSPIAVEAKPKPKSTPKKKS